MTWSRQPCLRVLTSAVSFAGPGADGRGESHRPTSCAEADFKRQQLHPHCGPGSTGLLGPAHLEQTALVAGLTRPGAGVVPQRPRTAGVSVAQSCIVFCPCLCLVASMEINIAYSGVV